MFSTLVHFALQSWSHYLPHVVDINGLKTDCYGWFSKDDMGKTNHIKTLGSDGPPSLQTLGWILDGISLLLFLARQCSRCCSDYRNESDVQNRQWTDSKIWSVVPNVLSAIAKGSGCVWYVCIATGSHLRWCCLLSFLSTVGNITTCCFMADAVDSGRSW